MFFRCITRTFWVFYDNLFKGLFLNLICFFAVIGLFTALWFKVELVKQNLLFAIFAHIAVLGFLWHTLLAGYMHFWIKIIRGIDHDGMFREIGRGIAAFWWRGIIIFAVNSVFMMLAWLVINFYRNAATMGIFSKILGGIGIWLTLVFLLMQLFIMPILVMDEKKRIFTSYKKAAIMVMSTPFTSIFVMITIAYLLLIFYPLSALFFGKQMMPTMASLVTLFPIFFLPFMSYILIMLMAVNLTMLIFEKHKVQEDLTELWEKKGMSNFFRPWESK